MADRDRTGGTENPQSRGGFATYVGEENSSDWQGLVFVGSARIQDFSG